MKYAFLSGGTGTPKLLQGFRQIVNDEEIAVICNNGDDYIWNGLHICPDLDTILYQFSHKLDLQKFWGVEDDTFKSLDTLKSLNATDTWFNVGDKDLGLHIYRTKMLKSLTLTQITQKICESWGIKAQIVPMSDKKLQTRIYSETEDFHFQEYFVKHQTNIDVKSVNFVGERYSTSKEVKDILEKSKAIIIGPSNPVTSIGPIVAIQEIYNLLYQYRGKVILISPLTGNKAFSGPTVKLMKAMNLEPNSLGIAKFFNSFVSKMIIDETDRNLAYDISSFGIEPIFSPIEMSNDEQKKKLAESILDFI